MLGLAVTGAVMAIFSTLGRQAYQQYRQARDLKIRQMQQEAQLAETDSGLIEYKLAGEAGPVIMVLHGILGTYQQAFDEFQHVVDHGYRLLAVSRPGYANSQGEPSSAADYAEFYCKLLDHLQIDDVIVIAMSASGVTGIEFARLFPERCQTLVMMAPAVQPLTQDKRTITGIMKTLLLSPASDLISWCVTRMMIWTLPIGSNISPMIADNVAEDESVHEQYVEWVEGFFPVSTRANGFDYDLQLLANLPIGEVNLKVPSLILHGEADQIVPVTQSHFLEKVLANTELRIIGDNAGHTFYASHQDEVWTHVFDFIKPVAT